MHLADRIAQCRAPLLVQSTLTGITARLSGAAECASDIAACPQRFVLTDDLTQLCTALACSKGAHALACADLLHVPAEALWVEWSEAAWQRELVRSGFAGAGSPGPIAGRRGSLIKASRDGRRGLLRSFWTGGDAETGALASSMEAYFDLDTPEGEAPSAPDGTEGTLAVCDELVRGDLLRRCFRFRYERTWAEYYARTSLTAAQRHALARHALGTIAFDVPVLLAFFLLLATRTGLPRTPRSVARLNQARARAGRKPLLDFIEVSSPLPFAIASGVRGSAHGSRRPARLHHVRGHLVRRDDQIFWRVPHLRGSARSGVLHGRTVTWRFDAPGPGMPAPAAVFPDRPRQAPRAHHAGQRAED